MRTKSVENCSNLINELKKMANTTSYEISKELKQLIARYKPTDSEEAWNEFNSVFQSQNPDFFGKLEKHYPNLNTNEKRIAAFMYMNMTTKEISSTTLQSVESIRKARIRLRKKFGVEKKVTLHSFMQTIK